MSCVHSATLLGPRACNLCFHCIDVPWSYSNILDMRISSKWYFSLLFAIGIVILVFPMLAVSPQSGDSAEQVIVALRGGVLHPPGFPLQSWFNRLFILIPFWAPATRLAFLGLLAHAGAAFVIAETARKVGCGLAAALVAAGAYAFFPPTWYLAVQPEVFALSHLLIALIVYQAIYLAVAVSEWHLPGRYAALGVGILTGLAGAQHAITITMAPAFVTSALLVLYRRQERGLRFAIMAGSFALVFCGLYATLPLLRTDVAWPDWGKLASMSDLYRHATRQEFGTFSLSVLSGDMSYRGINVFFRDWLHLWHVLVPVTVLGIVALFRSPVNWVRAVILAGSASAGLFLLANALVDKDIVISTGVLERFEGPVIIPFAVLVGMGLESLRGWKGFRGQGWVADCCGLIVIILFIITGWERADASKDRTLDVFQKGAGMLLPKEAVYIAHSDVETAYGADTPGELRFPIEVGMMSRNWYLTDVLPRLEPRIKLSVPLQGSNIQRIKQYINEAVQRNYLTVYSSNGDIMSEQGRILQLRGLFVVAGPEIKTPFAWETVDSILKLCTVIQELKPLPKSGHAFTRGLWTSVFWRAFSGTSYYLKQLGRPDAAAVANQIAEGLTEGRQPETWVNGCQQLRRLLVK